MQVAQLIGAGRDREAEDVLRQGLKAIILLGLAISAACLSISGRVPRWLGGEAEILADSTAYFRIYCLGVPFILIRQMSNGMMQSTGDMKTPSALSALVCLLNVVLNRLMIFPASTVHGIPIPGAGLRVVGAAIATTLSEVIISLTALYLLATRNKRISLRNKGSWKWKRQNIENAAESLCYMPGYGIGAAATAIIGQTIGAGRHDLTKSFSRVSVYLGMVLMGLTGGIMYFGAPLVFSMLTSSAEVAALGTEVLRIELIAEPLYGASICCAGVFRGAGDTLRPSIMNLVSMWCVRITLALFLVPRMGLQGFWTAMALELCFRGLIFLVRLYRGKWMKKAMV